MSDYTDIQQELDDFKNAVYGEEVRDSMVSAIKKIHDIAESAGSGGSGLTDEVKNALLACFRGVVWKGDADPETLYGALDNALNPPADLASISVVYSGGTVDAGASLESLKTDLTVTAHYTDSTSETVTAYTLSGNLAEIGEQTITVTYGGKSTTFTVTVTSDWTYVWDFTKSLTDTVSGQVAVASAKTGVDAPAITNDGLAFTAATQRVVLIDNYDLTGKTIEIDVASMEFAGDTGHHIRLLLTGSNVGPLIWRSSQGWAAFINSNATGSSIGWTNNWTGLDGIASINAFSGKTIRIVNDTEGSASLYIDGELIKTKTSFFYRSGALAIGGGDSYSQSDGDQIYNAVIKGVRIKDTEVTS